MHIWKTVLRGLTAAVIAALCLLWPAPTSAQSTVGTILGAITDPTGAAVPAAVVTVHNTDTGVARSVSTDASGAYQIAHLSPGSYSISVEHPGFRKAVVTGIGLQVN